jgi:cytochrome b involved in lipid metabolism
MIQLFYRYSTAALVLALMSASLDAVTIEEVQQHGSYLDCWSAIYGKVYDFTDYGATHRFGGGNGPQRVWNSCGVDYTEEFDQVHGDSTHYLQWEGIVEIGDLTESTVSPTTSLSVTETPEPPQDTTRLVTIDEVRQHGSSLDCWSAIYGKVYDFTDYGESHTFAGGPQRVWDSCGVDYTEEFDQVHGDSKHYLQWEGIVEIGDLTESTVPAVSPTTSLPVTQTPEPSQDTTRLVTIDEVRQHGSSLDCWSAIYGKVYDFTDYGESHTFAGGPQRVWDSCGVDYTEEFDQVHGDSKHYLQWEGIVEIGDLAETTDPSTSSPPSPTTPEATESASTTPEPDPLTSTGSSPPSSKETISLDELSTHSEPDDCWVLFYDEVYNLTQYAYRHPVVGEDAIHPYCGASGTDAFAAVHEQAYLDRIEDLVVGPLEPNSATEPPIDATDVSAEEVARHNSPEDCWIVFYDSVYDMTQYSYSHPGPAEASIHPWCGLDGTTAYDAFHEESLLSKVQYTKVGDLSTSAASASGELFVAVVCIVIAIVSLA